MGKKMTRKYFEIKRKLEENAMNVSKKKRFDPNPKKLPRENVLQEVKSWLRSVPSPKQKNQSCCR